MTTPDLSFDRRCQLLLIEPGGAAGTAAVTGKIISGCQLLLIEPGGAAAACGGDRPTGGCVSCF